jgi:hypothetical protein
MPPSAGKNICAECIFLYLRTYSLLFFLVSSTCTLFGLLGAMIVFPLSSSKFPVLIQKPFNSTLNNKILVFGVACFS